MLSTNYLSAHSAVSKLARGARDALAVAAVGSTLVVSAAFAGPPPNLVTNGTFAITNPDPAAPSSGTSFSFGGAAPYGGPGSPAESLAGWTFIGANSANTIGAGFDVVSGQTTAYWQGQTTTLFASGINAPNNANFVAIDANFGGAAQSSGISQSISTGLVIGQSYTLSFSYALAQWYAQGSGPDTAAWTATLFGTSQTTPTLTVQTNGITSWATATFTFVANATSTTLQLLATPATGVPPLALVANVSLTKAPEPTGLALFGTGIAALMLVARKRRMTARTV
jgi:hypothetical protein